MADLIELYEKARLLNLQNLAHGKIDLNQLYSHKPEEQ